MRDAYPHAWPHTMAEPRSNLFLLHIYNKTDNSENSYSSVQWFGEDIDVIKESIGEEEMSELLTYKNICSFLDEGFLANGLAMGNSLHDMLRLPMCDETRYEMQVAFTVRVSEMLKKQLHGRWREYVKFADVE